MVLNDKDQVADAISRGQRRVERLRNTVTSAEVAGMSTDDIMKLLRPESMPPGRPT